MHSTLPSFLAMSTLVLTASAFGADQVPATATTGAVTGAPSSFSVGGGAIATSRYSGADQRFVSPIVIIDYQDASGIFASTLRGVGYASVAGPVNLSVALGYRCGRGERDSVNAAGCGGSTRLRGMGDIKGSAVASIGVDAPVGAMLGFSLRADLPVSARDNGKLGTAGASAKLLERDADKVTLGLSVLFGDGKYLQTYYGVTAAQAAGSGYRAYQAGSGVFASRADLGWDHRFDAHWGVSATVGVQRLSGDAASSPIVKKTTMPTAGAYASYQF